ncbi:DUF4928 family protein [Nocardia sp. NBC_01327]|uniref:DUF4928 family protein n=1 Tax=Nocardia sp. NBC_01327 TaxID=2903593 RepID=UPI002E10BA17|nr:DUF4928 family protein [Nocardia sp. NBC_01327]
MVKTNGLEQSAQVSGAAEVLLAEIQSWYESKRAAGKVKSNVMCAGLYITDFLAEAFPLTPDVYQTKSQVKGSGGKKAQALLADHGESREFRREGGRTSRLTIEHARELADTINSAGVAAGVDTFTLAQRSALAWLLQDWFVARVRDDFPFDQKSVDPTDADEWEQSGDEDVAHMIETLIDGKGKVVVLKAIAGLIGDSITESDLDLIANRKDQLKHFQRLLFDESFFQSQLEKNSNDPEAVWRKFFGGNQWIFGYGLTLISCESYDSDTLEHDFTSATVLAGADMQVDALLRTRSRLSGLVFCGIKPHSANLIEPEAYRPPDVYRPGKDLVAAVSQVQKTADKAVRAIRSHLHRVRRRDGERAGFEVVTLRPRQIVIAGMASQFESDGELNPEKVSSFELYRRSVTDVEIITFDELLARAAFIVADR